MKKQYHEIMDNLVVTEEMRARILPGLSFTTQPDVSESLTAVNGITEVSSSAELSAAVGFPVAEVTDCPFPAVLWYRG